jgi:hypothetical protein
MNTSLLESRAAELRQQLEWDHRFKELMEIEAALRVLKRYEPKAAPAASPAARAVDARPGSTKEFIAQYLKEKGPSKKTEIAKALAAVGRTITPATLTSALSKSNKAFVSNGNGVWSLNPNPPSPPSDDVI